MKFIRCVVAGLVALVVGGASGAAIAAIFISTPLQRVLDPHYSEFDFFGLIGVALFGALIASVASVIAAAGSNEKLHATFQRRNLLTLILAPLLIGVIVTFTISRDWAWLVLIHLAASAGIFSGIGAALRLSRGQNPAESNTEAQ